MANDTRTWGSLDGVRRSWKLVGRGWAPRELVRKHFPTDEHIREHNRLELAEHCTDRPAEILVVVF